MADGVAKGAGVKSDEVRPKGNEHSLLSGRG
jgi:hypothetical protein